ncbi:MAG: MurR/RpiR family transcriptional regulator [Chloroflexota bacterium]
MSYENRIRENRLDMSKSFSRLADYILDSYIQAALMTATELAHQVDVDAATVVRFAQKLGYRGFPELQSEIKDRVKQDLLIRPEQAEDADSVPGVVSKTMHSLLNAIEQARMLLDGGQVADLVKQLGKARRIIIMPESLGQAAAYNLVNLLEQGGFIVTVAQPGVTDLARTVATITKDDLLLAIDVSGDAPFIARAIAAAKAKGVATAAIVGAASHQTAVEANVVLAAQNQKDIGIGIVVVDAITYTLAEALRWQYADKFAGADEALEELFERIQVGN